MVNVGPMELIIVLVIALLVLGPKRLPEAGRAVGKGMREFKDSLSGITDHDDDEEDGEPHTIRDGTTTSSSSS
jgi:sec-independent protein translocase protein TatA